MRPAIAPPGARAARASPRGTSGRGRARGASWRSDGVRTPLREAGPPDAREAVVFLHGNPGSGADWEPLLAAVGRRARAVAWDAPGLRPVTRPRASRSPSRRTPPSWAARSTPSASSAPTWSPHDFGGPWGLAWAAGDPERFAGAVLIGTGALPGYRWHALARLWRTPVAGELFMATTTRLGFRALLRRGNPRGLPRAFVDRMYDDFDRGTRRAVLRPLPLGARRRAPPASASRAALRPLDRPALVLWGRHDPYLPVAHAERQRAAFPRAEVRVLERSGHWPFVDDPEAVSAAVASFLDRQAIPVAAERAAA